MTIEEYIKTGQYDEHKKAATQALLNRVYDVCDSNTMICELHKNSHTVPIFDKFYYSDAHFLMFRNMFHFWADHYINGSFPCYNISLVIHAGRLSVECESYALRMTTLKQYAGSEVLRDSDARVGNEDQMYPLIHELCKILRNDVLQKGYIPFETPCFLGAQKSSNRTGFGSTWNIIGKQYGEIERYFIIGVQIS